MIINHNLGAMNAQRQMSTNQNNMSDSMEKLSSGLRINRAGDDAAGLAISEKMRGQIRGLEQADRNAQDGISLIQTAEGALNESHSILQRMRELSVQSSNDTNTSEDRAEIQKEVDQLTSEIDRIANSTEFNTKKLLNGDSGAKVNFSSNANVDVASATEKTAAGTYSLEVTTIAEQAAVDSTGFANTDLVQSDGAKTVEINGRSISFDYDADDAAATADNFKNAVNNASIGVSVTGDNTNLSIKSDNYGSDANVTVTANTITEEFGLTSDTTTDASDNGVDVGGEIDGVAAGGKGLTLTGTGDTTGLTVKLSAAAATSATAKGNIDVSQNALTAQIGANEGQEMSINLKSMGSADLNVNSIDVTSQDGASAAITTLDDAIKSVSAERSKLGAYQNRLEHTINNLGTSAENLTAAESRIRDVDMAKEMMNMTKNNILSQASQSMLAQANQQPQSVLQLLQ
ncbi:flagellin [Marinococcus sp. PL1-022]|uniref:flagellin N-terminal helical domain-containing protein n=1 Tax=Marinococcus sp. PL1-022 TaxID=3095363 RepID=UPI0029C3B5C8|nr:flagellin [Marinococcus sp. PL1-022]MDX6151710.1 flagellin [Marinococcus sp. PL1-022]